jgi:hypothetical protein
VRRRPPAGDKVPEHLEHFDVERWGGLTDVLASVARWRDARRAWVDAGNRWPGGVDAMVDGEFAVRVPDEIWDPSKI